MGKIRKVLYPLTILSLNLCYQLIGFFYKKPDTTPIVTTIVTTSATTCTEPDNINTNTNTLSVVSHERVRN